MLLRCYQTCPKSVLTFFNAKDVVRHPIVQRIVMAYEAFEAANPKTEADPREWRRK